MTTTKMILLSGFDSLVNVKDQKEKDASQDSLQLQWYCAPDQWPATTRPGQEGYGGKWNLVPNHKHDTTTNTTTTNLQLQLFPPAKKDFWRHTYYRPVLVKDDGPAVYATLDRQEICTVTTSFELSAHSQFDQAGLWLRWDHNHWIKTGIEVVDGRPRLSSVVTNHGYSDWATQSWPSSTTSSSSTEDTTTTLVECTIRLHCRGQGDFVVESWHTKRQEWEMIRICHLLSPATTRTTTTATSEAFQGPAPQKDQMWVGVFACCPANQPGNTHVVFDQLEIVQGSDFDHHANENAVETTST